jgi:hypothetical protein
MCQLVDMVAIKDVEILWIRDGLIIKWI